MVCRFRETPPNSVTPLTDTLTTAVTQLSKGVNDPLSDSVTPLLTQKPPRIDPPY